MKEELLKTLNEGVTNSGKTQKFIAGKLEMSEVQLHRKLNGEMVISIIDFVKICEVLDLNAKKIFHTLVNLKYEKAI